MTNDADMRRTGEIALFDAMVASMLGVSETELPSVLHSPSRRRLRPNEITGDTYEESPGEGPFT